jgi:tRNA(Ile)-lysidine synthase
VRAAESALPIGDGELDSLFADVAGATCVALAVSGGADSLALLDCADRWRKARSRPEILVLTVDHRLRPESPAEAAMVAAIAEERGLRHRTLVWEGSPPASDIEAEARRGRYRLLLGATREAGAGHLLVAHHRDDQAETFLMRLMGGSGTFGLAAMRPSTRAGEVTILRPFLGLPRSRLAATTAAAGLVAADDPMNADPRFLRARIRRAIPLLAAFGLDPETLTAAAARLRLAADAIESAASAAIARHVTVDDLAMATLARSLFEEPAEVVRRVLIRILMAIGGEPYPPRSERLGALLDAMRGHAGGRFKRTLAGVVAERRGAQFVVYREIGRAGLEAAPLRPGRASTWDHRFRIEPGEGLPDGLTIGALGEAGRLAIGAPAGAVPASALAALPAIRRETAILAVPSLGHGDLSLPLTVRAMTAERIADPPGFPAFDAETE